MKTLAEFVAVQANPERRYGTTAAGGTPYFVGMMLAAAAGVAMTLVHYRGARRRCGPDRRPRAGEHQSGQQSMTQAKAGTIRMLAVTGSRRLAFLPDVPTMVKAANVVVESWLEVSAGKDPAEIVNALSSAIGESVDPRRWSRIREGRNEPHSRRWRKSAATVKADIARWSPVGFYRRRLKRRSALIAARIAPGAPW